MNARGRGRSNAENTPVTKDVPPPVTAKHQPSTHFVGEIDVMEGVNEGVMDIARREGIQHADMDLGRMLLTPMQQATPAERPGYKQQWVMMVDEDKNPDPSNKARYFSAGFRPRCPSTLKPGEAVPVYKSSGFEHGVIVFAGEHLLCEIEADLYDQAMAQIKFRVDRLYKNIQPEAATGSRNMSINPVDASELMD